MHYETPDQRRFTYSAYRPQAPDPISRATPDKVRLSIWRIVVLSFVSNGLYFYYWMYLTWKQLREQTGDLEKRPVWHALTQLMPIYGLFRLHRHMAEIESEAQSQSVSMGGSPGAAVVLSIVSNILVQISLNVFDVTTILILEFISTALILLFLVWGQRALNGYWRVIKGDRVQNARIGVGEVIIVLLGASITVFTVVVPLSDESSASSTEQNRVLTPTATPGAFGSSEVTATSGPTSASTAVIAATAAPSRPHGVQINEISLAANAIIYDPVSEMIYASISARAGGNGNSVALIDPKTGMVGPFVFVGSEPNKLAVSDDGRYLYVSLEGASAVRRVDLTAQVADIQFPLLSKRSRNVQAEDIEVLPGKPESVAVSLKLPGSSPDYAGVVIFDHGVERPARLGGFGGGAVDHSDVIEFSETAYRLYGASDDSSPTRFYKLEVDQNGVTMVDEAIDLLPGAFSSGDIEFEAGLIYTGGGAVIDPEAMTLLGQYDARGMVAPAPARGVTFILQQKTLIAFAKDSFMPLASIEMNEIRGRPLSLIRWGVDGLAVTTDADFIYLIRVPDSALSPIPPTIAPRQTPLPTVTPTPQESDASEPLFGTIVGWPESEQTFFFDDHNDATTNIFTQWSINSIAARRGAVYALSGDTDLAHAVGVCDITEIIDASTLIYEDFSIGQLTEGDIIVFRNTETGYYAALRIDAIYAPPGSAGGSDDAVADMTWFAPNNSGDFSGYIGVPGSCL